MRRCGKKANASSEASNDAQLSNRAKNLLERKQWIEEHQERCPSGWQLDPTVVDEILTDENTNMMIPGYLPTRLPLNMPSEYVLDKLPFMDELQGRALIDEETARKTLERSRHFLASTLQLNAVLFEKSYQPLTIPRKWLRIRFLRDRWKYDENDCVYSFGKENLGTVTVSEKIVDPTWLNASVQRTISDASVFVLLVEDLSEMETTLSEIIPTLNHAFPESHLIPSFLCFITGNEIDEEDINESFNKLNLHNGIKVIDITEHLTYLRDKLYHELCLQWRVDSPKHLPRSQGLFDPFNEAVVFLENGLFLRQEDNVFPQ